jgi:hypothetical protein
MKLITLESFHNKWMHGFIFCHRAYSLFNQIRNEPDGIERLRMRKSDIEKKLIEEILPIAKYIQLKSNVGNNIKIKWVLGNQQYDAVLKHSGVYADKGVVLRDAYLEVTGIYHRNHYLAREHIQAGNPVFGLDGLVRDKKSKKIISNPNVHGNLDFVHEFGSLIIDQIETKSKKAYPSNTILLVECSLDKPYYDDEWELLVGMVEDRLKNCPFMEVFLYDSLLERYATLHYRGE